MPRCGIAARLMTAWEPKCEEPALSICRPVYPRKPPLLGVVGTAEKCQNRKRLCPLDAALRARNSASRHVLVREPLAHIDMLGKNVSILPKPDGVFRSPSALQRPFDDIDVQAGRNSGSQECYRFIIRCDASRSPTHDEARRVEKRASVVFVRVAA